MPGNSLKTSKITQIELADGWHVLDGELSIVYVWLTDDLSMIVFRCVDDHGNSLLGGLSNIVNVHADGYANRTALDLLDAGIKRLTADPPPYQDGPLAREVRALPEAMELIGRGH